MSYKTERLTCPGCGFPISVGMKECPAGHPINISTFNSVYDMPMPLVNKYANTYRKDLAEDPDDKELNNSIGICYLKLKLYDKALEAFEKAMEDNFDNSETFFYAAICLLQGKKAFLPQGPWILAGILNAPVFTSYNIYSDGRYHSYLNEWGPIKLRDRKNREEEIKQLASRFIQELEEMVIKSPYDWFNFYNFWQEPVNSQKQK